MKTLVYPWQQCQGFMEQNETDNTMMNPYLYFFKTIFTFLMASATIPCLAQPVEILDANNFRAGIGRRGSLFTTDTLYDQFVLFSEVPKGNNTSVLFFSSLIMSGIDAQGKHHFAAPSHNYPRNTYYDGPVATQYDSLYDGFYRRVFKITRQQVDAHLAHGIPVPAISIDPAIKYWPAAGNPYTPVKFGVNIEHRMAPFVDVDGNNSYNPAQGDYPAFCGEQAVFFVFNDERGSHDSVAGSNHLGFEVRGMAEQFLVAGSSLSKYPVNNGIFAHYEIENKSLNSYSDYYLSMLSDPDVGCFSNDAIGCDVGRNLTYAYNRQAIDSDCQGVNGYGNLDVAVGVQQLNTSLSSFVYLTNGGTFDLLNTDSSYYYFLRGFWGDGAPITEGGIGRGGTVPTKYVYPGTPTDMNTWNEVSAGTTMGDRRMLASSSPGTFAAGEVRAFDYAFFASYDSTAPYLAIVDTLRRDADIVQQFYDDNIANCRTGFTTNIDKQQNDVLQISVYPNPAKSQLVIEAAGSIALLEIKDALGRIVLTAKPQVTKTVLNVSGLAKGIYLLKIEAGGKTAVKKIVVE